MPKLRSTLTKLRLSMTTEDRRLFLHAAVRDDYKTIEEWAVSTLRRASAETNTDLIAEAAHFRTAFDHAAGMALVAASGEWRRVNGALCQILGYSEQELLATNFQEVTYPDDLGDDLVHIYQLLEGKRRIDQREKRYLHKSGHPIWVLQSASVARNAGGDALHLILQIQDITERKRADEQVFHAAYHDALTDLPNRMVLADYIDWALNRIRRNSDRDFAVIYLDLDRFKFINDTMGHAVGDEFIIEVSSRLNSCVGPHGVVARLGGAEFGILIDRHKSAEKVIDIANLILHEIGKPIELKGLEFVTTASLGIAFGQAGYDNPEDLLRDADIARYQAKTEGKGRYVVFDADNKSPPAFS